MAQKLKTPRRLAMMALAIIGTGANSCNAASFPYWPNTSGRGVASQRVDTRSYRHCHNNEGRFVRCYTRKPGEAIPDAPRAKRKAKYDNWWFDSDDGRRKYQ